MQHVKHRISIRWPQISIFGQGNHSVMKKAGLGNQLLHWGNHRASASADSPFHLSWDGDGAVSIFEFLNIQTQRESTENLEEGHCALTRSLSESKPWELTANLQAVDQMLLKISEITQWAHAIQERDKEHLQCDYRILRTDTSDSPLQGITLVPMKSSYNRKEPNGGYQGFLHILRELTQSPHRLDIQK